MINRSSQKIFNNSLLYAIGTVASKAVGFFLVPIYTNNLNETEYGIATTVTAFVSALGIIVMMSLRAAMIRFYNEYDEKERPRFVGTIFTFVMLNALVICGLLCLLNRLYMPFLFKGVDFFPCVFWGVMALGCEGVYLVYQSLLQAKQDGKNYSLNSMVYLLFHAVTVVVFVAVLKMGATGMVFALFVSNACFALYGFYRMYREKYLVLCLDRAMLTKSLRYSIPIIPHNLSNNLNNYAIKLIISHYLTYALSGLYSLAAQFSTIINLVQSSVNLAFRPWFIEQMDSGEEGRKQIKHMSCMIMALYSFCAVCIALFSKEIIVVMANHAYMDAWKMVPLFVFTQLISFIYYSHVQMLMYDVKMSRYTMVCSFSGLLVNVVVSLLLVGPLGIYGILIAQIVSKVVLSAVTVVMSRRAEKVDFGLGRMILCLLCAALLMAGGVFTTLYFEADVPVAADAGIFAHLSLGGIAFKLLMVAAAYLVFLHGYRKDLGTLVLGMVRRKKHKGKDDKR